ncbi:thioester domain-containing protein [Aeromicrobium wangtongii]|uniref:Thioester domain-containing protein n=1 Tax=Aeromicrobium wangtongii TaxID=2969247 RepID=A0ABY5M4Y0_9ACTN|nr:thioester domain-containing protein [Aeromicrobium wangtongii]MCD9198071.1 thioester domain-containing protein [Aeromicrobium wangtongii]UUP12111.1 thioester domain-containing protein [Aeromicrobium wangtongii]
MEINLTSRTVGTIRVCVVLVLLTLSVLMGRPAHAEPEIGGSPIRSDSPFTELRIGPITGELGVTDVDAFVAPADFDPLSLDAYPSAPPAGSVSNPLGYAGIIPALDADGETVQTYCIDLLTSTETGVTYQRGDWAESNVRNLGYVGHILQNYYPTEPDAPAGVPDNVKAAAVQAAIWYFSDRLVLDPAAEPQLYALTSQIVNEALANGPATEPVQPTLSISPEEAVAPSTGEIVGPFPVTADGPSTLRLQGVEVFLDAAGTQPLGAGDTVQPGAQLWARSTTAGEGQGFSLQRQQTVRESTVYLYDAAIPGRDAAQKLVLARTSVLEAVAGVRITQFAAGGIEVAKTISGGAAGQQGAIEVRVVCTPADGGEAIERSSTIPAGTAAGPQTIRFTGLPEGATCVVSEPQNGDNDQVRLTASSIDPGTVTVVEGQNTAVAATNQYERALGRLEITKRILGPAAGRQGEIVISVDCDGDDIGNELDQTFTIPAESAEGSLRVARIDDIPVGTRCQVTENKTGAAETIVLEEPTTIEPGTATIVEDRTREVVVTNRYREQDDGGGDNDGGDNDGGGGNGGGGGSDFGGGYGGGSSGNLPGAGASGSPAVPLTVAIALLLTGGIALAACRQAAAQGATGTRRPA